MERGLALGKKAMEVFSILAFIAGLGWFVAKPRAEDFIKETVADRLTTLEQAVDEIKRQQKTQELSGIRTESDLNSIKAKQDEVQDDIKTIIRKLIEGE